MTLRYGTNRPVVVRMCRKLYSDCGVFALSGEILPRFSQLVFPVFDFAFLH